MRSNFIFIVIGFLCLTACETEPRPDIFGYGEEYEFQLDVNYRSSDNRMKLTIEDVQDSRCPLQMMCFWQGEARVKVNIDLKSKYELELSTFDNQADTVLNYLIRLVNVYPYPEIPNNFQRKDHRVVLEVTKLRP